MASFPDHFSAMASRYAAYRPRYPEPLVDLVADRTFSGRASGGLAVAWDVGCGNGQLSVALTRRFSQVIATDPAQAQLDHAQAAPGVEYRCAPAEASGLDDASVDLAVAAQAAHWFDWPRFVAEAGRVVRPGGLVALVSYANAQVDGAPGAVLAAYYQVIEPYWPNGRVHVNNGYRDLVLPWPVVDAPSIEMTATWTRDELFGYLTTWSATSRHTAVHGAATLEAVQRDLAEVWPATDTGADALTVRWPLTVKLARR